MIILDSEKEYEIDEKISQEILLKIGLRCPENSILEIANKLGVDVFLVDLEEKTGNSNIEGMIDYSKDQHNPKIFIDANISIKRRNFTLAHELGHLLLHEPKIHGRFRMDSIDLYNSLEDKQEELEANYFAASLLVPKEKLLKFMNSPDLFSNTDKIAEYFAVSEAVILTRIRWLKRNPKRNVEM